MKLETRGRLLFSDGIRVGHVDDLVVEPATGFFGALRRRRGKWSIAVYLAFDGEEGGITRDSGGNLVDARFLRDNAVSARDAALALANQESITLTERHND